MLADPDDGVLRMRFGRGVVVLEVASLERDPDLEEASDEFGDG